MWFALCEISGEMLADGHEWPLKFNQSRLYKELRCNHSKLNSFFTYVEHRRKISVTYVQPTFSLEIPSLSKYIGKYSEISPNKRKEKEIKEKEIKLISEKEISPEKNLPEKDSQEKLKKQSPLSFLFHDQDIKNWLDAGTHETHMILLKKFSHHELAEQIERAFVWATEKGTRAEQWLYTWMSNKSTQAYGYKNNRKNKITSPENPTGDPYLQEAIDKGLVS